MEIIHVFKELTVSLEVKYVMMTDDKNSYYLLNIYYILNTA